MNKVIDINEARERKFMLPYYKVEEVTVAVTDKKGHKVGSALRFTCQRFGCKKSFITSRRIVRRSRLGTAPCPNCMAVSIIPGGNYKGP